MAAACRSAEPISHTTFTIDEDILQMTILTYQYFIIMVKPLIRCSDQTASIIMVNLIS